MRQVKHNFLWREFQQEFIRKPSDWIFTSNERGEYLIVQVLGCSQPIDHSTPSTTGWVEYSILPPTVTTGLTGGTWEPHLVPLTVCQGPPTTVSTGMTCPHRRGRRSARWRNIRMCVNIEMDYTNTLLYTYNYHFLICVVC